MELNQDILKNILSLDDRSFAEVARKISEAAGGSKAKTEALLSDINGLKSMIANLSPRDAEKLMKAVGKEKSDEILRTIQNNG